MRTEPPAGQTGRTAHQAYHGDPLYLMSPSPLPFQPFPPPVFKPKPGTGRLVDKFWFRVAGLQDWCWCRRWCKLQFAQTWTRQQTGREEGMARRPICPTPPPSLGAVPGGGFGLALPYLPCPGGGGGVRPQHTWLKMIPTSR